MLYAKTIIRHLKQGGRVEDWLTGEPGMSSNGGRYYRIYKIRDGVLQSRSSYEDADWEEEDYSLKEFADFVRQTWDDKPFFVKEPRWELT